MFDPSNKLKMSSTKSNILIHVGHKTNMGGVGQLTPESLSSCWC